jgi:hypothetical protein
LLVTFERHRLRVTSADPLAGCPAGRLHVTSADPLKMAIFAYFGKLAEFYLLSLNCNVYVKCSGETTSN